jgi:hypothetical protein
MDSDKNLLDIWLHLQEIQTERLAKVQREGVMEFCRKENRRGVG